ncbi:Nramp family divalent metal transporter [Neolewinella antarctica]|uniref:NRAMP (Natural resistance-associated macrophage protein)-like metal ion transporter n=1 Tax=Neolewinella antarctica TaxID=442734 RepID=A0ABX0XBP8_9BACT|nr:Nramp family divalent metal transporter [Neolewinella antarctica]NJC26622.1 NRAMP (natural resistance-associated macrophage protein)-like metal ion transporter [Neolewinella antarctica]
MPNLGKYFGPSTLVAAAFIGPGTLTTCTLVGVQTGYSLLWVMLLGILATVALQEMAARLGLVTGSGLGEALNRQFPTGLARYLIFFLAIGAILVGNAAYEAGNIAGGVLGLDVLIGGSAWWPVVVGLACVGLIYFGNYKWVERVLITLVLVMSTCFLITVVLIQPDLSAVLSGFIPGGITTDNLLLVTAVIGTTVVPYNLFLHASTVSKKYARDASLRDLRIENAVSICLGGMVSLLIIITAAGAGGSGLEVRSAVDMAVQLEPLFGSAAKYLMGVGLLAAGISSALTAPLAAAYAARGLFNWPADDRDWRFRTTWLVVILIGIAVAVTDVERVAIIKFAQVTNALLLPLVAGYLLWVCNSRALLGGRVNSGWANLVGGLVILVALILSVRSLVLVFG